MKRKKQADETPRKQIIPFFRFGCYRHGDYWIPWKMSPEEFHKKRLEWEKEQDKEEL
jgi:hypothetical protein